ncbi:hypothetical protein [Pseudovibrio denitrificans]|nr:hypothetical protein [Pseudovibrio denitrificans]
MDSIDLTPIHQEAATIRDDHAPKQNRETNFQPTVKSFDTIVSAPLFSETRKMPEKSALVSEEDIARDPPEDTSQPPSEQPVSTSTPVQSEIEVFKWKLTGVVLQNDTQWALFQKESEQVLLKTGETLDGWVLVKISEEFCTVEKQDQFFDVHLYEVDTSLPPSNEHITAISNSP